MEGGGQRRQAAAVVVIVDRHRDALLAGGGYALKDVGVVRIDGGGKDPGRVLRAAIDLCVAGQGHGAGAALAVADDHHVAAVAHPVVGDSGRGRAGGRGSSGIGKAGSGCR